MQHDYSKLKGRIVEKNGTFGNFGYAMGWSPVTRTKKLAGKVDWTQADIEKAITILDIDRTSIPEYFFTLAVINS